MDPAFNDIFTSPENSIFKVVFFPDRVYHSAYLNATRSDRYRYNVQEVRNKVGSSALKGEVYFDGLYLCNFLRIEYRPERLVEVAREKGRFLRGELLAWIHLIPEDETKAAEARVKLLYDAWIDAYQVEIWETLEAPPNNHHDFSVLDLMGQDQSITRIKAFTPALRDIKKLKRIELAFRENDRYLPSGYTMRDEDAAWDNNFLASHQEPRESIPSSPNNTVSDLNYLLDFQRGWYLQASETPPVHYLNPLMDKDNPDRRDDNIVDMRWLVQRQAGNSVVFFHEVTIPVGATEGAHHHIGSEELYYIVEGEGIAYMGDDDDPQTSRYPLVQRPVFGEGTKPLREIPVKPGSVIFTKSGGRHGIRNTGNVPLKFVAFLYQSA